MHLQWLSQYAQVIVGFVGLTKLTATSAAHCKHAMQCSAETALYSTLATLRLQRAFSRQQISPQSH
jgi:hypothetical protein